MNYNIEAGSFNAMQRLIFNDKVFVGAERRLLKTGLKGLKRLVDWIG
jgi:hypothetical protein